MASSSDLPTWLLELRPLADSAEWLAKLAKDPVTVIRTVIAVIIVGGVIDIARQFIDAILAVWESLAVVPKMTASLIGDGGSAVGDAILGVVFWYAAGIETAAASLGPFGIFLQVVAYVGTAVLLVRTLPPLLTALSDLLGSVPVVGSVLDAVLTFGIELADSLGSVFRSD